MDKFFESLSFWIERVLAVAFAAKVNDHVVARVELGHLAATLALALRTSDRR